MSILSRLSQHLDDRAFAAIWAEASLEGTDPSHPHLAACSQCRARCASFGAWLDGLRGDATSEADDAFTAERLVAQQAHILRRLEAAERPARVITFPSFAQPMAQSSSHARRWITAAAAAAFIIGVAVGQVMDIGRALDRGPASAELRSVPPRSDRPDMVQPVAATFADPDAVFMAEIEASVTRTSLNELHAFDAITPRAPFTEGVR